MRTLGFVVSMLLSITLFTTAGFARSPSLIGVWRGDGTVQPKDGAKETTRCRARVLKAPARGKYTAVYRCSSPMGLVTQEVELNKVDSQRYKGSFRNTQHNISGDITIILDGDEQTVTMESTKGIGLLNMLRK